MLLVKRSKISELGERKNGEEGGNKCDDDDDDDDDDGNGDSSAMRMKTAVKVDTGNRWQILRTMTKQMFQCLFFHYNKAIWGLDFWTTNGCLILKEHKWNISGNVWAQKSYAIKYGT